MDRVNRMGEEDRRMRRRERGGRGTFSGNMTFNNQYFNFASGAPAVAEAGRRVAGGVAAAAAAVATAAPRRRNVVESERADEDDNDDDDDDDGNDDVVEENNNSNTTGDVTVGRPQPRLHNNITNTRQSARASLWHPTLVGVLCILLLLLYCIASAWYHRATIEAHAHLVVPPPGHLEPPDLRDSTSDTRRLSQQFFKSLSNKNFNHNTNRIKHGLDEFGAYIARQQRLDGFAAEDHKILSTVVAARPLIREEFASLVVRERRSRNKLEAEYHKFNYALDELRRRYQECFTVYAGLPSSLIQYYRQLFLYSSNALLHARPGLPCGTASSTVQALMDVMEPLQNALMHYFKVIIPACSKTHDYLSGQWSSMAAVMEHRQEEWLSADARRSFFDLRNPDAYYPYQTLGLITDRFAGERVYSGEYMDHLRGLRDRVMYHGKSGDSRTAARLFWNGTTIVDDGGDVVDIWYLLHAYHTVREASLSTQGGDVGGEESLT